MFNHPTAVAVVRYDMNYVADNMYHYHHTMATVAYLAYMVGGNIDNQNDMGVFHFYNI